MINRPVYAFLLIASWIAFFVAQVLILNELPVTILAILFTGVLMLRTERGEWHLFFVGLSLGLIIEVGLGLVGRTQFWAHASFFGVPYWLPIMWGYGLVIMRRIGNAIVQHVQNRDSEKLGT